MWTRPPAKRAARAATPSEEIERMDPSNPIADYTAFFIQVIGSLLFGIVFLFLWRQSRAVYFGLWAAAWGLRGVATIFGFELLSRGGIGWLAPYATFDFAFAIVLIAAARAGFGSGLQPRAAPRPPPTGRNRP